MSNLMCTPGRVFQEIKALPLIDWLNTLKADQLIRVVRGESGWLWLQCNDTKEVYITDVWEKT